MIPNTGREASHQNGHVIRDRDQPRDAAGIGFDLVREKHLSAGDQF
jgi:hypothetical protein